MLIFHTLTSKEICIARGKGKKPNSLVADDNFELLAFPYLFQTGKFDYDIQRDIKLSPAK